MKKDTWINRKKSFLVKWFNEQRERTPATIAPYLGCSSHYFNTKLQRNSFSFEDILKVAFANDYEFIIRDKENLNHMRVLTLKDFLSEDEIQRIVRIKYDEISKECERLERDLDIH